MAERIDDKVLPETEFKFRPDSVALIYGSFFPKWYSGELRSIGDTDKVRAILL